MPNHSPQQSSSTRFFHFSNDEEKPASAGASRLNRAISCADSLGRTLHTHICQSVRQKGIIGSRTSPELAQNCLFELHD